MQAIQVHAFGGAEQLRYSTDVPAPMPRVGEVLVRNAFAGLNFKDVLCRTGTYHAGNPSLPFIPGIEAAGVVESVAAGVTAFQPGDRVAYLTATLNSDRNDTYADYTSVSARGNLVKVPDEVGLAEACAAMVQGLTAHYLTHDTYRVRPGDLVLVQAAAGGVGSLVVQLCKRVGATVIGTVSSDAKVDHARNVGCDHVVRYREESFVDVCRSVSQGRGVDVVFDGVGKPSFLKGLDCLKKRGTMVVFGNAGGAQPDPLAVTVLTQKGSLHLARPALYDYLLTQAEMQARAHDLFGYMLDGSLRMPIGRILPLRDAEEAHRALEAGQVLGKWLFQMG